MEGKTIEELLKEVGENSPFKISKHLGVHVEYKDILGDVVGMYIPGKVSIFFINSSEEYEVQEKVCFQLLAKFIGNKELSSCITKQDILHMDRSHQILTRMKNFILNTKFAPLIVGMTINK
ncbi:hypothetical protein EHS13_18705 [Paenibacillus psychroresistens]|uniref:Uncharacterized protein n=1 Tax=Paenibacillus psychroresistens TaxID=1778678 RepID=A0A6B8RMI5_9BACL|nr:hypothetical protein [Paenibacillus psychroresistens]QGQ96763.1 hypothetical protein EHS13_18705 [Paenibacillus psychroresistens]